jgi:hypothetical protein
LLGPLLFGQLLSCQLICMALLRQLLGALLFSQLLARSILGTTLLSELLRALLVSQLLTCHVLRTSLLGQLLASLLLGQLLPRLFLDMPLLSQLLGSLLIKLLLPRQLFSPALFSQLPGPLLLHQFLPSRIVGALLLSQLLAPLLFRQSLARRIFGPPLLSQLLGPLLLSRLPARKRLHALLFEFLLLRQPLRFLIGSALLRQLALGIGTRKGGGFLVRLLGHMRGRGGILVLGRRFLNVRQFRQCRLRQHKAGIIAGLPRYHLGMQGLPGRLDTRTAAAAQRAARRRGWLGCGRRGQGRRLIAQCEATAWRGHRRRFGRRRRRGGDRRRAGNDRNNGRSHIGRRHWR